MIVHAQSRPPTSLRLLCDEAARYGITEEACLEGTSVSVADLDNPGALHSTTDEIRAIENLVRLAPENVGLGFAVGRATHVHAFGIWGFAILTSPTLRAAIETAIDFSKLSFLIAEMSLVEDNGEARLEFDTTGIPVSTHRYILERHTVIAVKFIRDLLQKPDFNNFEARLMDGDPDYPEKLAKFKPPSIKMGQPVNALAFPAEILDAPLPNSDPVSLKFCLDQCKVLLEEQTGALPHWSQQVRDAIVDNIGSEQQIEEIAARLAVTERTLRRRLTDEGTSFRQLYIDARMTIAYELLASAGLNVDTVSWRVGYAEPASFARAFTKHYGETPGEVRKKNAVRAA
ncbi:AraC family transcriptional regulator ligand-binding domain-containing protein [Hoeflea sp. E7-10]|uniref:AraC family transcriptional regulator ligand-binding domain-containing protein n=2 Tax=Hoeflea poritis TaxID=2993659 RepID=A0ABT4VKC0_9HYPH|nr:AraC family transcriptional regulator ligand-binding domain-containing protein [Hoeflea poritis]